MSFPTPDINDLTRPYWEGLVDGRLMFQQCASCGHNWLPARSACPVCLAPNPAWTPSRGFGTVVSWVVYHHAYADHLKDQLPYDVTIVELAEGPRLLTNVVNSQAGAALRIAAPVALDIETVDGVALARFRLTNKDDQDE